MNTQPNQKPREEDMYPPPLPIEQAKISITTFCNRTISDCGEANVSSAGSSNQIRSTAAGSNASQMSDISHFSGQILRSLCDCANNH